MNDETQADLGQMATRLSLAHKDLKRATRERSWAQEALDQKDKGLAVAQEEFDAAREAVRQAMLS